MQIKKIKASGEFRHRYIQINDAIYTFNQALISFAKKADEIRKVHYSMDIKNEIPVTAKFIYPSVEVMQKEIDANIKNIIENLHLKASDKQIDEFFSVYKLQDYFSNKLTYSMLAQEERGYQFEDNNYYMSAIKYNRDKLRSFNLKPAPAPQERKLYRIQKHKIYEEMSNENEFIKSNVPFNQINYLKGLYNVFVRENGVCSEFSNAFSYILNKIDIVSYKVLVSKFINNTELFHAYNLIEFVTKGQKKYYACDLTRSVCNKEKYNNLKVKNRILGFGMGSDQLEDTNNSKILSIQKYGENLQKEFFPQVEEDILINDLSERLIEKLLKTNDLVEEKEIN